MCIFYFTFKLKGLRSYPQGVSVTADLISANQKQTFSLGFALQMTNLHGSYFAGGKNTLQAHQPCEDNTEELCYIICNVEYWECPGKDT